MKVFYSAAEQAYQPQYSWYNGKHTPYPELPGRTQSILAALAPFTELSIEPPPPITSDALKRVHDPRYLETLEAVCQRLGETEQFFPFMMRKAPLLLDSMHLKLRMGYYAVDGSMPLTAQSFQAGLNAASTALAGANAILNGAPIAYGLPRPPGHHAGASSYSGYCLFNNAALASELLLSAGKVAILDVDFHHGNGSQEIFFAREDVLCVSLHCRPEEAYPFVSGTKAEKGEGKGLGYNLNLPMPAGTDWQGYQPYLEQGLAAVQHFDPSVVVVCLGMDSLVTDPIGLFKLTPQDFAKIGHSLTELKKPLLVIQEGGYDIASLGNAAVEFFKGLGVLSKTPSNSQSVDA